MTVQNVTDTPRALTATRREKIAATRENPAKHIAAPVATAEPVTGAGEPPRAGPLLRHRLCGPHHAVDGGVEAAAAPGFASEIFTGVLRRRHTTR
jgi:hypothetical protein